VFVSYSHDDREWLRRLLVLLKPVVRNRRFDVWADEYIPVGDDWFRNIADAIERAQLALLLVSGDFLASRFIMEVELPSLVERNIQLVPVLLSDCLWEAEPLLASVQWVHDPGRDGPLDRYSDRKSERDRRLVQIAQRCNYRPHIESPLADLEQTCTGCGQSLPLRRPGHVVCERCHAAKLSADVWRWLAPGYDH
jgi:hypothetical protein